MTFRRRNSSVKDLVERLETEAKKRTGLPHILAEAEAKKRAETSTAPRRPPGSSSSGPKPRSAGVVASFALGLPPPPPPFTAGPVGTVPARQRVPSSGSSRSCVTTPVRRGNGSSGAAMSAAANRLPSTGSTRFFNRFLYIPRLAQIFFEHLLSLSQ
jgi:hypothetical protein